MRIYQNGKEYVCVFSCLFKIPLFFKKKSTIKKSSVTNLYLWSTENSFPPQPPSPNTTTITMDTHTTFFIVIHMKMDLWLLSLHQLSLSIWVTEYFLRHFMNSAVNNSSPTPSVLMMLRQSRIVNPSWVEGIWVHPTIQVQYKSN